MNSQNDISAINLRWLLRLRWGAILGQTVVILFVETLMGIDLPLLALFAVIAVAITSNIVLHFWSTPSERAMAGVLGLDILLLTALLYLSGGSFNPFNFLYLVYLALAAVVVRPRYSWSLSAMALLTFGLLFLFDDHAHGLGHAAQMELHLRGMWVAFAVAAMFIVYFVTRVRRALAERENELQAARERAMHNDKLAALATLAGGAAHELATPLSTIAVVAHELADLVRRGDSEQIASDAELIEREVSRCRSILNRMSHDQAGETTEIISVNDLLDAAVSELHGTPKVDVACEDSAHAQQLRLPTTTASAAIRALIENARAASRPDQSVHVSAHGSAEACTIVVQDRGEGMDQHILQHATEPFFTTKETGKGMGLGLFLAREIFERLGGKLQLESAQNEGTTATITLPWATATPISESTR